MNTELVIDLRSCYVYVLFDERGMVMYVGSSTNVLQRLARHNHKGAARVHLIPCAGRTQMLQLEKVLIREFNPALNIIRPDPGQAYRLNEAQNADAIASVGAVSLRLVELADADDEGTRLRARAEEVFEAGLKRDCAADYPDCAFHLLRESIGLRCRADELELKRWGGG